MKIRSKSHAEEAPSPRLKSSFSCAAVLAVTTAALLASCTDRAETYLGEARRYELDYDFENAARRYELVVTGFRRSPLAAEAERGRDRCRAEVHFTRAENLIYAGATYTALGEITAGRRLDAENPRGLYLVGLAHLSIGPRDLARQEFDACITEYPDSPYGYLGRAEYFRFKLQREKAFADFTRAFRVARRDARARGAAFRGLRDMALRMEQPERAEKLYRNEGRGGTPLHAFHYWIGYYYLRKPPLVYRDARDYFNLILQEGGTGAYKTRALARRAECHLFYKEYDKARADIDQALAADPENDEYYAIAAEIYAALGLPPPIKTPQK